MNWIHVNWTREDDAKKRRVFCYNCKKRTTFYCFFQEYYGWDLTCIQCGDMWTDGEWIERPFRPRWRQERIASAKRRWSRWRSRDTLNRREP